MKKILLITATLALVQLAAYAQEPKPVTVTGKVTSKSTNEPIPASIRLKNEMRGIAADSTGSFKLSVANRVRHIRSRRTFFPTPVGNRRGAGRAYT